MSRKPITTYAGGKGPRQRIWEAIRRLAAANTAPFTEGDIWDATEGNTSLEMGAIRDYRRGLVSAGILKCAREPEHRGLSATYLLVVNEGLDAPRVRKNGTRVTQGLAQEQMWRTLRMLKTDTNAHELIAHSSTPDIHVAQAAAKDYLLTLCTAGYLECTQPGHGIGHGGIQARYRLMPNRNTGPRPPMICRTRVVYDPNEDKIVWQPPVSEEEAIYGR